MTQTMALIRRNTKLFFKDKGMLFTAMITPCILLVLYATIGKSPTAKKLKTITHHQCALYTYIVLFFTWWIVRNIWF